MSFNAALRAIELYNVMFMSLTSEPRSLNIIEMSKPSGSKTNHEPICETPMRKAVKDGNEKR
jgi:hypothetical protein